MENLIYSWKFSDKKNRSKLWYIVAIAIIIGLCIWGVFTKQYGLSLIVILAAGVVFFVENNSPDEIIVKINDLGIKVDETFYEFSKINNYSYIYHDEKPVLIELSLEKKGLKSLKLQVNKEIYNNLEQVLPNFLQKVENSEFTSGEKLINYLKL